MGATEDGYTQLTDETELLLPSDLLIAVHFPAQAATVANMEHHTHTHAQALVQKG